jgi:hypothetical protein
LNVKGFKESKRLAEATSLIEEDAIAVDPR